MLLHCVELEGFRRFKRYRLAGLARVNLLVGDNNSGKTSVLEAVSLLVTGGAAWNLANLAWSRGEIVDDVDPGRRRRPHEVRPQPNVSHFFFDHKLQHQNSFIIRDCKEGRQLKVTAASDLYPQPNSWGLIAEFHTPSADAKHRFPITEDGVLRDQLRRPIRPVAGATANVQFLALSASNRQPLATHWAEVLKHRREDEVAGALRILEPQLEDIVFPTSEAAARYGGPVGIFVGLKDAKERVPLASMGEGMYRLLELALGLVQTSDGVLLVDEIDTGLHYSVLGDVWRLIVTAARKWQVQVFATTHSFDGVRALAWLLDNYPELATDISAQKIDARLDEAVALDAERIRIAIDQGIEVR